MTRFRLACHLLANSKYLIALAASAVALSGCGRSNDTVANTPGPAAPDGTTAKPRCEHNGQCQRVQSGVDYLRADQ